LSHQDEEAEEVKINVEKQKESDASELNQENNNG